MTDIVALAKAIEDLTLNAVTHFQQLQMTAAEINAYLNALHVAVVKSVIHTINIHEDNARAASDSTSCNVAAAYD